MTLTSLSTLSDIKLLLVNIVKSVKPEANLNPGYPLYDLLVESGAEIVYKERNYIHIINNIQKVLTLFDDSGNLLYPQYEDLLKNKYFIGSEAIDAVVYSVTLIFSEKCDFIVKSGSTVDLNGIVLSINPISVSKYDDDWVQDSTGYGYTVYTVNSNGMTGVVDPSFEWNISDVEVEITGSAVLRYVANRSAITFSDVSTLTFDVVRNSISNRSYSNARAIGYNLRTNTGFSPDSLKQYEVLRNNDPYYIDNYYTIYKYSYIHDITIPIKVKASGRGKIMFDYGYDVYITPITFEYAPDGSGTLFSTSHSNRGIFKASLPYVKGVLTPLAIFHSSDSGIDAEVLAENFKDGYESTSILTGEYRNGTTFTRYTDDGTIPNFKDNDVWVDTGLYRSGANILSNIYLNGYVVENTTEVTNFELTNLDYDSTDDGRLYIEVSVVGGVYTVNLYKDSTGIELVATGYRNSSSGEVLLAPAGTYSVSGSCELVATGGVPLSSATYVCKGSYVVGLSNKEIFIDVMAKAGANPINILHDTIGYLVYIGTDPEMLSTSDLVLKDPANAEIVATIDAAPYRAVCFSAPFNQDYIFPYQNSTAKQNSYNTLIELISDYFNNFTGDITDIDFKELASTYYTESGLYLKKLDYVVFTQDGYILKNGSIDLSSETGAELDWETILDGLDYLNIPSTGKTYEKTISVSKLYKPVFSKYCIY